jgi:hypothetical protein
VKPWDPDELPAIWEEKEVSPMEFNGGIVEKRSESTCYGEAEDMREFTLVFKSEEPRGARKGRFCAKRGYLPDEAEMSGFHPF